MAKKGGNKKAASSTQKRQAAKSETSKNNADVGTGDATHHENDVALVEGDTPLRRRIRRHVKVFGKTVDPARAARMRQVVQERRQRKGHLDRWKLEKDYADAYANQFETEEDKKRAAEPVGFPSPQDGKKQTNKNEPSPILNCCSSLGKWVFIVLFSVYAVFFFATNFPLILDIGVRRYQFPDTLPRDDIPQTPWCPTDTLDLTGPLPRVSSFLLSTSDAVTFRKYPGEGDNKQLVTVMIGDAYCDAVALHPLAQQQARTRTVYLFNATFDTQAEVTTQARFDVLFSRFISQVVEPDHGPGFDLVVVAQGFSAGHALLLAENNECRRIVSKSRIISLSPLMYPFGPVGQAVQHRLQTDYVLMHSHRWLEESALALENEMSEYNDKWSGFSDKVRAHLEKRYVAVWRQHGFYAKMRRTELDMFYPLDTISPDTRLASILYPQNHLIITPATEDLNVGLKAAIEAATPLLRVKEVEGDHWTLAMSAETNEAINAFASSH